MSPRGLYVGACGELPTTFCEVTPMRLRLLLTIGFIALALTTAMVLASPQLGDPPFVLKRLSELEGKVETLEYEVESVRGAIEVIQEGGMVAFATPLPPTVEGTPIPTISPREIERLTFEEACKSETLPTLGAGELGTIRFPEGSEWGVAAVPGMDVGGIYRDITGGTAPTFDASGVSPGGFAGPVLGANHDFERDGLAQICLMVYPGYTIQFLAHPYGNSNAPDTVFQEGNHYLEGADAGKYLLRATGLKNDREIVVRLLEYRRCISNIYC